MNSRSALRGLSQMVSDLRRLAQPSENLQRIGNAAFQEAQVEMTESKRLVPVDTGELRASGHVERPTYSGRTVSVALVYATDYAYIVHEDLEAHHPHGQAKYLEQPLRESAPFLAERIGKRLKLGK